MTRVSKKKSDPHFLYWEALARLPRYQHSYVFLMQHFNQNIAIIQYWFESTRWFDHITYDNHHAQEKESTRLYNVSLLKLANFIIKGLSELSLFRRAIQVVNAAPHCVRLGFYSVNRRAAHCVLLGMAIDEGELEKMINYVLIQETPSVLLLPSIDDVSADNLQALRIKGSQVVALQQWQTQAVLIDKQQVVDTFNDIHRITTPVKLRRNPSGQPYRFPTPPGANWEDFTFQFINGETIQVTCDCEGGYASESVSLDKLELLDKRSDKPNKLGLLLKAFAQGHGMFSWPYQGVTSQQRTLKYALAKSLQASFGIYDSDPFVCEQEDSGRVTYQALFNVLPE